MVRCTSCGAHFALTHDIEYFAPPPTDRYQTCAECEGFGQVATGSRLADHATRQCPTCQGQGYVDSGTQGAAPPPSAPVAQPPWPGAVWDAATGAWK